MGVVVKINNIDRTSVIKFGSLTITDRINNDADICSFSVENYGDQTYFPQANDEVVVEVDSVKRYGGVILTVDKSIGDTSIVRHSVTCKDYSQFLDRKLATERYENTDMQTVVLDLIDRYASDYGFTGNNVLGSEFSIKSISFNELTLSDCFTKLARLTGYSWYIDYDKDVHFFKKNDEPAPFNLSDNSNNFIFNSLSINDDISQIRNKVKVRGGEIRGEARSEFYAGNGEQDTFPLGNKFAEAPTVIVDGVGKTVGIDFLNQDDDYDVMWSFTQKYLRFTSGNIPPVPTGPATTNIEVNGVPLSPIVVQRQNNPSVVEFGVYEFVKYNDSLKTRDEAIQFAQAELETYADAIRNGSFLTYQGGLRSGQTITINSTLAGVSEKFLIQSVKFKQLSPAEYVWDVEVATLRNISMIDILQQLLLKERISEGEDETLLNFFTMADIFYMDDEITDLVVTDSDDYVWEQGDPMSDTYPNPIVWNKFTWF